MLRFHDLYNRLRLSQLFHFSFTAELFTATMANLDANVRYAPLLVSSLWLHRPHVPSICFHSIIFASISRYLLHHHACPSALTSTSFVRNRLKPFFSSPSQFLLYCALSLLASLAVLRLRWHTIVLFALGSINALPL